MYAADLAVPPICSSRQRIGRRHYVVSMPGRPPAPADFDDRLFCLMVSVRNPAFSRRQLSGFFDLLDHFNAQGEIIIFDAPYARTIVATTPCQDERARELTKLDRITRERIEMVQRIRSNRCPALPVRSFEAVANEADPAWNEELRSAFAAGGAFRDAILARSREVLPAGVTPSPEFLLFELPVLLHLYLRYCARGVVDVYPGENPPLIWDVLLGRFADELPAISRAAGLTRPLLYVDSAAADDGRR
ncbi:MAG: hypothetical protein AAGE01_14195 [Pseudomonadota bacterium]